MSDYNIKILMPDYGDQPWNKDIIEYSYESSVFDPFDKLNIKIFPTTNHSNTIKNTFGPKRIQFYINNFLQFDGKIGNQNINSEGVITLTCKNYLNDMNVQMFTGSVKLKQSETILKGIERNTKHLGYGLIKTDWAPVKKQRTGINFTPNDTIANLAKGGTRCGKQIGGEWKPEKNEKVFDFIRRLIQRYNLFLHVSDSFPDYSLIVPNISAVSTYSINRSHISQNSNILESSIDRNWENVPTYIRYDGIVVSNTNGSANMSTGTCEEDTTVKAEYLSKSVDKYFPTTEFDDLLQKDYVPVTGTTTKLYRPMIFKDDKSKNLGEIEKKRNLQIKKLFKDTLIVRYTIQGHKLNNKLICPDTIVQINDELTGINKDLYISDVSFSYNENDGPTTSIICYDPVNIDFTQD
jgi:hypothetical protein